MNTNSQIEHLLAKKIKQYPVLNQPYPVIMRELQNDLHYLAPKN